MKIKQEGEMTGKEEEQDKKQQEEDEEQKRTPKYKNRKRGIMEKMKSRSRRRVRR
jgi:hypothetical protein